MDYNARIELAMTANPDAAEKLVDEFAAYHAAAEPAEGGRLALILTFPATSARQAAVTVLALLGDKGYEPVALEVQTTEDYDRRIGTLPVPELLTVSRIASELGVSRQAVQQRIDSGALEARKVGNGWLVTREEVNRAKLRREASKRSQSERFRQTPAATRSVARSAASGRFVSRAAASRPSKSVMNTNSSSKAGSSRGNKQGPR